MEEEINKKQELNVKNEEMEKNFLKSNLIAPSFDKNTKNGFGNFSDFLDQNFNNFNLFINKIGN